MRGDMKISRGRAEGDSRIGQGTFTGLVHQDTVLENRPAIAINDNFFAPARAASGTRTRAVRC